LVIKIKKTNKYQNIDEKITEYLKNNYSDDEVYQDHKEFLLKMIKNFLIQNDYYENHNMTNVAFIFENLINKIDIEGIIANNIKAKLNDYDLSYYISKGTYEAITRVIEFPDIFNCDENKLNKIFKGVIKK